MHVNTNIQGTANSRTILIHVLKKFLDAVFRRCCSFSTSQSENTSYAHVVFFLVFDNANASYSFDGYLNRICFFGGCVKTVNSFESSFPFKTSFMLN